MAGEGELRALLERVENAVGTRREIDSALVDLLKVERTWEISGLGEMPRYSASVDAALALTNRVLPFQWADVLHEAQKRFDLHARRPTTEDLDQLPLAILAALLRTLIAEQQTK